MATKEEVELFLSRFIQKVKVFGIVFRDDRGKNMQTLLELEITPKYREDVIMNLDPEDYVEGPIEDTLNKKEKCGYSEKRSADVMCILRFQWASVIQVPFVSLFT